MVCWRDIAANDSAEEEDGEETPTKTSKKTKAKGKKVAKKLEEGTENADDVVGGEDGEVKVKTEVDEVQDEEAAEDAWQIAPWIRELRISCYDDCYLGFYANLLDGAVGSVRKDSMAWERTAMRLMHDFQWEIRTLVVLYASHAASYVNHWKVGSVPEASAVVVHSEALHTSSES
jgi:hypothetical protein